MNNPNTKMFSKKSPISGSMDGMGKGIMKAAMQMPIKTTITHFFNPTPPSTEMSQSTPSSLPKKKGIITKVLDNIEGKMKEVDEAKREKNKKMIMDNWGSVESYNKTK